MSGYAIDWRVEIAVKYTFDEQTGVIYSNPSCVDECLFDIWAIGCDYDGCHSAEDLQMLVDTLVELAQQARALLHDGKLFCDVDEEVASYREAKAAGDRFFGLQNIDALQKAANQNERPQSVEHTDCEA